MLHCVNKYIPVTRHIGDCKVPLYTQIFLAKSDKISNWTNATVGYLRVNTDFTHRSIDVNINVLIITEKYFTHELQHYTLMNVINCNNNYCLIKFS